MPPKHRRLVVWGLLWLMLLNFITRTALDALGITEPWSSLMLAAVLAAVFIPLLRGSVTETRALRAEGIDLPAFAVTRKAGIYLAITTGLLWFAFAALAVAGQFTFPLVPIAMTLMLAFQARQWKALSR
ncbi:hypothetical protein [Arthrobacter sp. B3I9]|uniref:hypothetical protein n=1 Tax=Arthrobacter sp. B3I9 TaxID=3042270 RepID=UPI0027D88E9A|nr:hypothetical protein [Arthrobacter sp. B3I9]